MNTELLLREIDREFLDFDYNRRRKSTKMAVIARLTHILMIALAAFGMMPILLANML